MASIFLDCFKNTGKDYIRIVEGYYFRNSDGTATVKRRTIKNLGPLSKFDDNLGDGLIYRLREKFKNQELEIGMSYDDLELKPIKPSIKNIEKNLEPKNIGYFFLDNLFVQLGIPDVIRKHKSKSKIEYDLLGITKLLTFNRILGPLSKKGAFEQKDKFIFPITTSNEIKEVYRTLDILNFLSPKIQKRMDTKIKNSSIGRDNELTYYDVTNYWFETMYGDEDVYKLNENGEKIQDSTGKDVVLEKGFRKKGVCKNNSTNPLVTMGLFIDNNGIPVSYNLFPGNTQDKTTLKEIIEDVIINKPGEKTIIVADNGVYSQNNMHKIITNGNGYIISKSIKKHWTAEPKNDEGETLRDWALKEEGYTYSYKGDVLSSKTKSRIYKRTLKGENGNITTIKEKQVVFWSKKHYEKELFQNQKFIEYLESCKKNPDKLKDKQRKSQEFIKVVQVDKKTGEILKTKPLVILLEDKIEKYKETMGYYSIVTSEVTLSDNEIKKRYGGLSRIEDSFRIIKSELKGRPIYVWTKEHINAHFLICFIALTIIRLIQYKALTCKGKHTKNTEQWEAGITAEKIQKTLNELQANHIGDGYYQITKFCKTIELLIKSTGLTEKLELPGINKIRNYKNKIARIKL